jgi:hypothetical protein
LNMKKTDFENNYNFAWYVSGNKYAISNLVPGITFTRYTQSQLIGKPNNLKVLGARK